MAMLARAAQGSAPLTAKIYDMRALSSLSRRLNAYVLSQGNIRLFSSVSGNVPSGENGDSVDKSERSDDSEQKVKSIVNQRFDEDGYYEETEGKGSQVSECLVTIFLCS